MQQAASQYRAEMSVVASFIQDRCTLASGARVSKHDLYEAYQAWCEQTRNVALDFGAFNTEIETFDPSRIVSFTSNRARWKGIGLVPATDVAEQGATLASLT